jgi:hypothetical protein
LPRLLTTISVSFACTLLLIFPHINAGNNTNSSSFHFISYNRDSASAASAAQTVNQIYDSLKLNKLGLSKEAFTYACKGYKKLLEKGELNKEGLLTICDFSQSSRCKRLYLIDLAGCRLLMNTYVAHGRNSGGEFARNFSNRPQSRQSSLGFYVTKQSYTGGNGLSLNLSGMEAGFNDGAEKRRIVVHGSDYIGDNFFRMSNCMGRSFGCPVVPEKYNQQLINTIKNGSCLFIYHPNKNYLTGSKLLNG